MRSDFIVDRLNKFVEQNIFQETHFFHSKIQINDKMEAIEANPNEISANQLDWVISE